MRRTSCAQPEVRRPGALTSARGGVQVSILAYIVVSGALGVAGQLVLKWSVADLGPLDLRLNTALPVIWALATNSLVILGLGITVSGTFFWLVALSRVDLSYAYPFASLNYIFVLLCSWWILGERPSPVRVIGVVVICLGVWAISRTPAKTPAGRGCRETAETPAGRGGVVR